MNSCPSDDELTSRLDSVRPDGESDPVIAHVEQCAACQERLDARFLQDEDLRELRQVAAAMPFAAESSQPARLDGLRSFAIRRELHRGGQGVVYEAEDRATGRLVALKTLSGGLHASSAEVRRFEREVRIAAGLNHPNIVQLHHCDRTRDGQLYFVMELVRGIDLASHSRRGTRLDDKQIRDRLRLFLKICEAVSYAHAHGVVHRDLKPSNILVDDAGEPHLLDFGLAKRIDLSEAGEDGTTQSFDFVGTLAWAAPEQTPWVDQLPDTRTDVHALGLILYHLLTGRHPFDVGGTAIETLRAVVDSTPPLPSTHIGRHPRGRDLDAVVLRALEKKPDDRYDTVRDLADDCRRLLSGRPVRSRRASGANRIVTAVRLHPGWVAAGLVLLIAAGLWRSRVRAAQRSLDREAILEVVRELGEKGPDTDPSEDREGSLWAPLLHGRVAEMWPETAASTPPMPCAILRTLRGVYAHAPVIATRRLPELLTNARHPTQPQLVFIPMQSDQDRTTFLVMTMPDLELQAITLRVQAQGMRIGPGDQWFVHGIDGAFVIDRPTSPRPQIRPFDGSDDEIFTFDPVFKFLDTAERELVESFDRAELDQKFAYELTYDLMHELSYGWCRRPDVAYLGTGKRLCLWRREANVWQESPELLDPSAMAAANWILDHRLLPAATSSEDPWSDVRVRATLTPLRGGVPLAAVSMDTEVIAYLRPENRIVVEGLSAPALHPIPELRPHRHEISTLVIGPLGKHLLTRDSAGLHRVIDLESLLWGEAQLHDGTGPLLFVQAIARHGDRVATAGIRHRVTSAYDEGMASVRVGENAPRTVSAWPAVEGRRVARLCGVAFVPRNEDSHVLLAGDHPEIRVWSYLDDGASPTPLVRRGAGAQRTRVFNHLAACSSNGRVAAASGQGFVHLFEFEAGSPHTATERVFDASNGLTGRGARISSVAWSPSGDRLVAGRGDGSLVWIDPEEWTAHTVRADGPQIRSVAASPDGRWVAAASDTGTVGLWRWTAEQPDHRLEHAPSVYAVAFSADGTLLYAGDRDGILRAWDLSDWADGEPMLVAEFRADATILLAVDGGRTEDELLTGGTGNGLMRWDLSRFDRNIALALPFWIDELDVAESDVVRNWRSWAERVLEAPR